MKPVLITISVLIFTLANTTIEIANSNKIKSNNFTIVQDGVYLNQDLNFTSEEIISSGCSSCHMQYSVDGKSMMKILIKNFDAKLLVHKENDPRYLKGLGDFIASHNKEEAAAKYVDYNRVVDYIANY